MRTFPKIGRQLKSIWTYCVKDPPGWDAFPEAILATMPDKVDLACCYARGDGVQMVTSVKDLGRLQVIHVSISPLLSLRPEFNEQDWDEYILGNAHEIIQTFFPGREFTRQPDDDRPKYRLTKHFYSVLEGA